MTKARALEPMWHAGWRMRGVTLIELLVSLVIAVLLIAGALTVYMQSRNTYRVSEANARLQEVARYAMSVIEPDVRLAGFWGLTHRADLIENRGGVLDTEQTVAAGITDNCGNNWIVDAARFVDGRDATGTGGNGYNLACTSFDVAPAADVLIVRRASSNTRPLTAGRPQIATNRMRGVIFKDGALPAGFGAGAASETRDLVVHAYYIRQNAPSSNGLPQFELRRQTLERDATSGTAAIRDVEIVPGVEDMQIQFGVDTTADGNADLYVNPESVPAGGRITAARIWLRVIAEERELGFVNNALFNYANANFGALGDDRRRVLISKTIQIRNSRV
jgi:type IV pilus assembly protein PilW